MKENVTLSGGILSSEGTFYLLVVQEGAHEDDEVVTCAGRRSGTSIVLTALTKLEEIQTLISLAPPWTGQADAAAMTPEGKVFFLLPDSATEDYVPGAGYSRAGAKKIGRMTAFAQVGSRLIAMGYGGQVYLRDYGGNWTDVSIASGATGSHKPAFYDVIAGPAPSTLVFGGSDVFDMEITPEMEAANDARDADALLDLLNAASGSDRMTIRLFDGMWHSLDVGSEDAAVSALHRLADGGCLVFAANGTVYRTSDFDGFEVVLRPDVPRGYDDVKVWEGDPLVLSGNVLSIFRKDAFEPFDPPLPNRGGLCLSVWPVDGRIAAIFPAHVQLFDGGEWTRLNPVMA